MRPTRAIPEVVSGSTSKVDERWRLHGLDQPIEKILYGVIDWKKRLNRLVELQNKTMGKADERKEIRFSPSLLRRPQLGGRKRKSEQLSQRIRQP
jgi:hypothetical protein